MYLNLAEDFQYMLMNVDESACRDYEKARGLEWLETNGLGGFACGTVAGTRTRRYHALLTAALKPPLERKVLLAGLEEFLTTGDDRFALSSQEYPDTVAPDGQSRITGFRLDPWPIWTYQIDDTIIERELFMVHEKNAVVVRYRLLAGPAATLEIRPFLAYRDYHELTEVNNAADTNAQLNTQSVSFQLYGNLPRLHMGFSTGAYAHEPDWYKNFEYRIEKERKLDFQESLFTPGWLNLDLCPETPAGFIASVEPHAFGDANEWALQEKLRREKLQDVIPNADTTTKRLLLAADAFIVRRESKERSIIAGYPWFGDWGRDTLIALPGLCLTTNRGDDARQILRAFAKHVSEGMIPNRFPDKGETPEYNTIDASLWFFQAAHCYVESCADRFFIAEILPILEKIMHAHISGTRYGIQVDDDGLLQGGEPGVQLTWMDAKVDDWVVTPRIGKPVEINALWYNALRIMETFEKRLGRVQDSMSYARRADRVQQHFSNAFWNKDLGCLYDVISPDGTPDPTIRPNQLLALSLPHRMLSKDQERSALKTVSRVLRTPMGIRSLAPQEKDYAGHYEGGTLERDGAYHQGTVWPWFVGAYVDAFLNVFGDSSKEKIHLREYLQPLISHMNVAGLNSVSEIFDADQPHTPRGCFAQAWSVAELLRAWRCVSK